MVTVSKVINSIFPYIKNSSSTSNISPKLSKKEGKILHKNIDEYLKFNKIPKKKNIYFNLFLKYLEDSKLIYYESEKIIKNDFYYGICDAIFKGENNKYILVDWKKCCIDEIGNGKNEVFEEINSSFNRYSLQLHIYKHVLKKYKIEINKMIIVNFQEDNYQEYLIEENIKWMEIISDKDKMTELMKKSKKFFRKKK